MQPLHKRLPKETLLHLYTELEMTDRVIAERYITHRSAVTHLRKEYGIPARMSIGRRGELLALAKFEKLGFDVRDMNQADKLATFDILLDGEIRIEVKTSGDHDGRGVFSLSDQRTNGNKVSDTRIRLSNGRTKKLYSKTADFFLFVYIERKGTSFYLIPSDELPETMQILAIPSGGGKYWKYQNKWQLLKREGVHA